MLSIINQLAALPKHLLRHLWGTLCAVIYWAAFAAMVPPRRASLLSAVQSWLEHTGLRHPEWLIVASRVLREHWVAILMVSLGVLWYLFWRSIRNRDLAPFIVLRETPVGSSMLIMTVLASEAAAFALPAWIRLLTWILPMFLLIVTVFLQAPCECRFWFAAPPLLDAIVYPVALTLDALSTGVDNSASAGDATLWRVAGGAKPLHEGS